MLKSPNTKCGFDIAKANQILDDAGWKKGADGIREKDGVKMRVVFAASINPVREKQQQVIKQAFQQAGKSFELQVGPDAGHSSISRDRMMEFFIETLVAEPSKL